MSLEQLLRFWGELGSEGVQTGFRHATTAAAAVKSPRKASAAFRTHAALRHSCSVAISTGDTDVSLPG